MSQLKDVLLDLSKVDGVLATLVVGRDGFVVEGMTTEESVDLEAVGAIVASNIAASDSMGRQYLQVRHTNRERGFSKS